MELAGKTAVVTGVSGQDGSYLAEYLIDQGVNVIGIVRTATTTTVYKNIEKMHNKEKLQLFFGDMASTDNICNLIREVQPTFLFNLAAQSHVGVSFDDPETTTRVNAVGYLKLLEAVRRHSPLTRVYQASTSEMFGGYDGPANEETPFRPRSPYGAAKLAAHWDGIIYRDSYNLFVCNGILGNHESPRRGENFVTTKIVRAAVNILKGRQKELRLGNLSACRDWGHSRDYVKAMVLMLQHDVPDDYVIGTGETHSVEWFLYQVFDKLGLRPSEHLVIDPALFRPSEVTTLTMDASKAKRVLGWQPETNIHQLIEEMIQEWLSSS